MKKDTSKVRREMEEMKGKRAWTDLPQELLEEMKVKRAWADLPQELLELIMGRLLFINQICFRATCRNWRSITSVRVPPLKQLPWLMGFDDLWLSYTLYDPSNKKAYKVKTRYDDPIKNFFLGDFQVYASKFGWLLVCCYPRRNLFFFNPFNKEVIKELPSLETSFSTATFSSPPTDLECMIFVLDDSSCDSGIKIRICSLKDRRWNTFESCDSFYIFSVVYSQRNLYLTDKIGALMMFSIDTMELELVVVPKHDDGFSDPYLVDSHGEIMLISNILGENVRGIRISKLDFLKKEWVEVTSLDSRTLFLGCTSFPVNSTIRELMDTVHYHSSGKSKFYSLKVDQIYNCTDTGYYGCAAETMSNQVWIEPPY